jgi:UDP-N-acetylmuramoyl-tripeptide--D-alanyl-D-alanine ligase
MSELINATYDINEIIKATGGKTSQHDAVAINGINGVTIDSRKVMSGNLYVALKGEKVDGHSFVATALSAGAAYCLVEKIMPDAPVERQILVDDCLKALQDIANYIRTKHNFFVIGVTGSVGKTSTKEILALTFAKQTQAHATSGNYNNHIGLPLTIANAPANAKTLILEMGMNHAGEINILSEIARPNIAIITTVDAVHLEFFESVAGIAHAKAEIMDGMAAGETVILPLDNPYFEILHEKAKQHKLSIKTFGKSVNADYRLLEYNVGSDGTKAIIAINGMQKTLELQVVGEHLAINALAVLAAIEAAGLNIDLAIQTLYEFHDAKGRGELIKLQISNAHINILDETYNASPASMRASFKKLQAMAGGMRKIAVLGDMRELGVDSAKLHASLSNDLMQCGFDEIYLVGELMQNLHKSALELGINSKHFVSNLELATKLKDELKNNDFILCKGSRGSKIEEIIAFLRA